MNKVKKFLIVLLAVLLTLGVLSPMTLAAETATKTKNITVTFCQTEARKQLDMVNEMRTGDEAWYYDEQGNVITLSNLSTLTWDYELEKVAMQRAAETVVNWAHTRPSGQSCFTAYPNEYNAVGENIARGHYDSEMVVNDWKETDDDYKGQGHRRNMLNGDFTAFAAACVEYNGRKYWVQEFGNPVLGKTVTVACDETKTVTIDISGMTDDTDDPVVTPTDPAADPVKPSDLPYDPANLVTYYMVYGTTCTTKELLDNYDPDYYIASNDMELIMANTRLATGMFLYDGSHNMKMKIVVMGDVDGDGNISVSDARLVLRNAVKLEDFSLMLRLASCVVSRTAGSAVPNRASVNDARSILRAAVSLESPVDWS